MLRRLLAMLAAVVAVIALAGCGDTQVGSGGRSDGTSSSIRELKASSFGRSMALAQSKARSVHLTGEGTTPSGETYHMSGDFEVDGKSLADVQLGMTMTVGPGKKITVLLIDRVFYLKASQSAFTKNPARPWVKIDLNDPTNPFGAMLDQMMASFEPSKVQQIYSAITRLNNLGVDPVNGVPARHYTVTVDTSRMVSVLGLDSVPGFSRAQLMAQLPDEVTSQVWLDAQNRPVKTQSGIQGVSTEMLFTKWGEPVKITAPPANQVMDFSQVGR
jgi:hypothetical protein